MNLLDIKIELRIDSPDILNGLLALANEISKNSVVFREVQDPIEKAKEPVVIPEISNEEPVKTVTLEEIRTKLAGLSQTGKQSEVKALIKKFGAVKLTDIPKVKYPELLKAAEEI